MNKFNSIKNTLRNYPYNDPISRSDKDLFEYKFIKFITTLKTNIFIFFLYFRTFRKWCLQIFNPDLNCKKNSLFWIGVFIRTTILLLCFSLIAPLMFNDLIDNFKTLSKVTIFFMMTLYFLRWLTTDLKTSFIKVNDDKIKFLIYLIRPTNIINLISWMVPMIIIYNGIDNESEWNVAFLIMIIYLFNIYNEIQYSSFSNGLLVLNFVFQKNWKILIMLIILLLSMVLIFSVIVLNIEKIYFDTSSGQISPILEKGSRGWFNSFWLCFITFTTIGYGDIIPITSQAKIVIMISAIFGIAFYSLFTSVIVNGFIQYLDKLKVEEQERIEQKYREVVNELNAQLKKKQISKVIYDVVLKKIQNDIKNHKKLGKKSIKLKSIERKNLMIKKEK